jgi:hypothetical protein
MWQAWKWCLCFLFYPSGYTSTTRPHPPAREAGKGDCPLRRRRRTTDLGEQVLLLSFLAVWITA